MSIDAMLDMAAKVTAGSTTGTKIDYQPEGPLGGSTMPYPFGPGSSPNGETAAEWLRRIRCLFDVPEFAPKPELFFLVVVDPDGSRVQQFSDRASLIAALGNLVGKEGVVYLFAGRRLHISKGRFKYLVDGEQRAPLFSAPEDAQIDEQGKLSYSEKSERVDDLPPR